MPTHKPHYEHLKNKWTKRQIEISHVLWGKHADALKHFATAAATGLMLLVSPHNFSLPKLDLARAAETTLQNIDRKTFLITDLESVLPKEVQPLTKEEEDKAIEVLARHTGLKLAAELEGKRLNRNYGFIGQEQHLARYPGDTMSTHFDRDEDAWLYGSHDMAPGLGAWGYFASSSGMTDQDTLREKYYIAVPTFLSEGFNERFVEYRDFFKFRKMLLVNPENGKAIVTVIGDSGPASWTGKHLGGSPEVMHYLERVDGSKKGAVLYFFVDDPDDKVQLGPVAI